MNRIKFSKATQLKKELEKNINDYFERTGEKKQDHPLMFLKAFLMLLWLGGSYAMLIFVAHSWTEGMIYAASLALAIGGVTFNIQHDANHRALSQHKWVNRIFGFTLDICGSSSYFWKFKHNIAHHSYTNIEGADTDIAVGKFARMAPEQPHYDIHRFQHLYIWFIYGFMGIQMHFINDFKRLVRNLLSKPEFPAPRGWNLLEFVSGKIIFFSLAFVIPFFFYSWWIVLLFYFAIMFSIGLLAAVVFQLAHCVDEAEHPMPDLQTLQMPDEWFVHQLRTTVNFAPDNVLATFYLGGLNHQVEHHLFHKITHIHYPKMAVIVEATCKKFGIPYKSHPSIISAIKSHYDFLKRMGQPQKERIT